VLEEFNWDKPSVGSRFINGFSVMTTALSIRYNSQGSLENLYNAIALSTKLLPSTIRADSQNGSLLNNLRITLTRRYRRLGNVADLKTANKYSKKLIDMDVRYRLIYHWTMLVSQAWVRHRIKGFPVFVYVMSMEERGSTKSRA
jgi:hypothetical protein